MPSADIFGQSLLTLNCWVLQLEGAMRSCSRRLQQAPLRLCMAAVSWSARPCVIVTWTAMGSLSEEPVALSAWWAHVLRSRHHVVTSLRPSSWRSGHIERCPSRIPCVNFFATKECLHGPSANSCLICTSQIKKEKKKESCNALGVARSWVMGPGSFPLHLNHNCGLRWAQLQL